MLKKKFLFVFVLLFLISAIKEWSFASKNENNPPFIIESLGQKLLENSSELPSVKLLQTALSGYELLKGEKSIIRPDVITIIDFSLPSNKERLWVLDLVEAKVLFHCLVSHGSNSGEIMADNFSNQPGSFASSPGFYTTGETYIGKHGFSLRLDGIENGINDNARERAIVIHGADYVSAEYIRKNGRLGRSHGCPAVPEKLSKEIIEAIKGGSCLFVYIPSESYLSKSPVLSKISSGKKG